MSECREFRFINGAPRKMLLVVEPRSSEFWIASRAMARILVQNVEAPIALDVEYLPNGLVVYVAEGSQVAVYQDGQLLDQDKRSRRLGSRLNLLSI